MKNFKSSYLQTKTTMERHVNSITGIESIDQTITVLSNIGISEQSKIKPLIAAYLFDKQFIVRMIADITNNETAEFIEGIGTIIKQNQIKNYDELAKFIGQYKKEIVDIDQCSKIEISI